MIVLSVPMQEAKLYSVRQLQQRKYSASFGLHVYKVVEKAILSLQKETSHLAFTDRAAAL